jgi:hypothetical protein
MTADQASKIRGALSLIHFSKYDWRVVQEQCRIIEHVLIEIEYDPRAGKDWKGTTWNQ